MPGACCAAARGRSYDNFVRAANRNFNDPLNFDHDIGIRVVGGVVPIP